LVEMRGVEPLTSALRTQRSAKLSYIPKERNLMIKILLPRCQVQSGEALNLMREIGISPLKPIAPFCRRVAVVHEISKPSALLRPARHSLPVLNQNIRISCPGPNSVFSGFYQLKRRAERHLHFIPALNLSKEVYRERKEKTEKGRRG
jgi:hypothetical protein